MARIKPIDISLVVKNNGDFNDETRPATVVGIQNGIEVYNEFIDVSDPLGNGRTRYDFPSYMPENLGDIMWTVTIVDDDPDDDMATATTVVR